MTFTVKKAFYSFQRNGSLNPTRATLQVMGKETLSEREGRGSTVFFYCKQFQINVFKLDGLILQSWQDLIRKQIRDPSYMDKKVPCHLTFVNWMVAGIHT